MKVQFSIVTDCRRSGGFYQRLPYWIQLSRPADQLCSLGFDSSEVFAGWRRVS
jgi:hypothetical protein